MARWGLVILPFAALVSLVVVALTSSSPSEITDRTRVSAEPVTYTVGPRVLQSHLVVRGAKHLRDRADVLAPPAAEGNRPVLTSLAVTVDATVSPCGLIGSVADRPIIAVAGVIQPYRDLRPGDVGTDVAQLRTALAACGHLSDDPPGVFGPTTTQAILDVYASIGFPPLTTQGTMGQLLAKRAELDRAENNAEGLLRSTTGDTAAAQGVLDAARAATTEFSRSEGVVVLATEIAVLGALPGRVVSIGAVLGQTLTEGEIILTIESGPELVRADITQSQRALLKPGLDAVTDGQPSIPLKVTRRLDGDCCTARRRRGHVHPDSRVDASGAERPLHRWIRGHRAGRSRSASISRSRGSKFSHRSRRGIQHCSSAGTRRHPSTASHSVDRSDG